MAAAASCKMQDFSFLQMCCLWFKAAGMWHSSYW